MIIDVSNETFTYLNACIEKTAKKLAKKFGEEKTKTPLIVREVKLVGKRPFYDTTFAVVTPYKTYNIVRDENCTEQVMRALLAMLPYEEDIMLLDEKEDIYYD